MTRIVLIRAVNVGGAKLPMADLREIATSLGATDVSTYIASGNLLCHPPADPAAFDRALEQAIEQRFGYFREVISRSPDELEAALAAYPFEVVEPKFAHLYFLTAEPDSAAIDALAARDLGSDEAQVIGRDLHLRYGDGVAGTKLTTPVIARLLGVQGTGRNLSTVKELLARATSTP